LVSAGIVFIALLISIIVIRVPSELTPEELAASPALH
jgi:hypothetical protein